MSYQVLARKWRPQAFADVVGQEHITRTLQNAITTDRLAHAFLFSGPRGVGKTTTARILAKALNCTQGPTPVPCGTCDSCRETSAGNSVDVVEIDGASNRGIEHIRELRETVKYAPVGGKYKVYVIDEVHMLTNEAFNALLKTLEEPPPRVMFIFATTEPQKIPATIHSRCQHYGFKRIPLHAIVGQLRKIADSEKINVSDQGLSMIARAAEGSMRDSQSLLDQAVSYGGMQISDEDIQITLGAIPQDSLQTFAAGLLERDAGGLLKQVDELLEQGRDLRQFLSGAVEHMRNLLVVKIAKEPGQIIELPAVDIAAITKQAAKADVGQLLMLFDSLSKTLDDMRWSPHQRFTFEIGLVKACNLTPLKPLADVLMQVKKLEKSMTAGDRPVISDTTCIRETKTDYTEKQSRPAVPAPLQAIKAQQSDVWAAIMNIIKTKKPGLASFLEHSKLTDISQTKLALVVSGSFQSGQAEKKENRDCIEQAAETVLNRKVEVIIQQAAELSSSHKSSKQAHNNQESPDPAIKDILQVFSQGEIIEKNPSDDR
jgi:DNA polymerase III subunit gamma/tau